MSNQLKSLASKSIAEQGTTEFKDCGKCLGEYKLIKLAPGTEDSHEEFEAIHYQKRSIRGKMPKPTPEQEKQEAMAQLKAKEKKAMSIQDEVESFSELND